MLWQAQWHAMRSFTRDKTVAQQRLSRRIVRRIASNARPCQLKQTVKRAKGLHTFTALPAVGLERIQPEFASNRCR